MTKVKKDNYIGERVKFLRVNVFNDTQSSFVEKYNSYVKDYYPNKLWNSLMFSQPMYSVFEKKSVITEKRFTTLFNYLYHSKVVNPAWILLLNNNSQPKFLTEIEIDNNLSAILKKIKDSHYTQEMLLREVQIIVENNSFGS